jgi:hypothetical protein
MAYYKKQEVVDFVNASCEKIKNDKHTPLTDPQKALSELLEEQDLVGFFWLELSSSGDNGVGIKMEGKVFVRLDSETYTDDRFALDSYHAAKEGVSVTDIIKKREDEKKSAAQEIKPDMVEALKNLLINNGNNA